MFLEAWRARDRAVLVDGTLRPWLLGIAGNVLQNSRRPRRRHGAALDRYRAQTDALVEPDHADQAIAHADAASTRRGLDRAFAALSATHRQVADVCPVGGLTAVEAAVALRLPVGTVKSRLAHARGRLRSVLRPGQRGPATDPESPGGHGLDERPLGAPTASAAS